MKYLFIVGVLMLLVGCGQNIDYIDGHGCAKEHRFNTDFPFCSELQNCIDDCNMVKGKFVDLRYQSEGIGNLHLCYCNVDEDIRNIW